MKYTSSCSHFIMASTLLVCAQSAQSSYFLDEPLILSPVLQPNLQNSVLVESAAPLTPEAPTSSGRRQRAKVIADSQHPLRPQLALYGPEGENTATQKMQVTLKEALQKVNAAYKEPNGKVKTIPGYKYGKLVAFLPQGTEAGFDFGDRNWTQVKGTTASLLNLMINLKDFYDLSTESLTKFAGLFVNESEKPKVAELITKLNAINWMPIMIDALPETQNAFFTPQLEKLGVPGMMYGSFTDQRTRKLFQVFTDANVCTHEGGHGKSFFIREDSFGFSPIQGGSLEFTADWSVFLFELSYDWICKNLAALTDRDMSKDNFVTESGEGFGLRLGLKFIRSLEDNFALTSTPSKKGQNKDIPADYEGSGDEVHQIGQVGGSIMFDVFKNMLDTIWNRVATTHNYNRSPKDSDSSLETVNSAWAGVVNTLAKHLFALNDWVEHVRPNFTLSAYFSTTYDYLDRLFDAMNLGITADEKTSMKKFFVDRAAKSLIGVKSAGTIGADEVPGNIFVKQPRQGYVHPDNKEATFQEEQIQKATMAAMYGYSPYQPQPAPSQSPWAGLKDQNIGTIPTIYLTPGLEKEAAAVPQTTAPATQKPVGAPTGTRIPQGGGFPQGYPMPYPNGGLILGGGFPMPYPQPIGRRFVEDGYDSEDEGYYEFEGYTSYPEVRYFL